MSAFINEFQVFFNTIMLAIGDFWLWFSGTIIGKFILFVCLISIFIGIINLIIDLKN